MGPQQKQNRVTRTVGDERAQGLIEFALLASVLFFVFLGTVDFARFMYYSTEISSAARVGAVTGSNHCPFSAWGGHCGGSNAVVPDTLVMWETYCEAQPHTQLAPQFNTCTAGTTSSWLPNCSGTCSPCSQDICVSPSSRSSGTQFTVSVGYSFHPMTLLIAPFFPDHSCFTGDSPAVNHHTLCAQAVGRVS